MVCRHKCWITHHNTGRFQKIKISEAGVTVNICAGEVSRKHTTQVTSVLRLGHGVKGVLFAFRTIHCGREPAQVSEPCAKGHPLCHLTICTSSKSPFWGAFPHQLSLRSSPHTTIPSSNRIYRTPHKLRQETNLEGAETLTISPGATVAQKGTRKSIGGRAAFYPGRSEHFPQRRCHLSWHLRDGAVLFRQTR